MIEIVTCMYFTLIVPPGYSGYSGGRSYSGCLGQLRLTPMPAWYFRPGPGLIHRGLGGPGLAYWNHCLKLTKRDRRLILHTGKTNRTWTNEKVRQECCPHASLSTLSRFLHDNGMRKWIAKRRPKLTEERAAKRLAWALERKDWSVERFQTTIWSDECTIEKSTHAKQIWVFRTPDEKWEKDCIMAVKKGHRVSGMVWGCLGGKQEGTFVPFIVKSVNAKIYLRILETLVLPVIQHINRTTTNAPNASNSELGPARFQQDNAPVHKAKIIANFLRIIRYRWMIIPPTVRTSIQSNMSGYI